MIAKIALYLSECGRGGLAMWVAAGGHQKTIRVVIADECPTDVGDEWVGDDPNGKTVMTACYPSGYGCW